MEPDAEDKRATKEFVAALLLKYASEAKNNPAALARFIVKLVKPELPHGRIGRRPNKYITQAREMRKQGKTRTQIYAAFPETNGTSDSHKINRYRLDAALRQRDKREKTSLA